VRNLVHAWSGAGVAASASNPAKGPTSRATFTAPANASQGQAFPAVVAVTDPTGLVGRGQITFVVADNTPPVATAPADRTAEDGPRGGTDNRGTVSLTGTATDADGDRLSYRWAQVDADGEPLAKPTVELLNANTATVSFTAPQLSANGVRRVHLAFTAIDRWGVGHTDTVTVTVLGRNERPIANAGEDQTVAPGADVRLAHRSVPEQRVAKDLTEGRVEPCVVVLCEFLEINVKRLSEPEQELDRHRALIVFNEIQVARRDLELFRHLALLEAKPGAEPAKLVSQQDFSFDGSVVHWRGPQARDFQHLLLHKIQICKIIPVTLFHTDGYGLLQIL